MPIAIPSQCPSLLSVLIDSKTIVRWRAAWERWCGWRYCRNNRGIIAIIELIVVTMRCTNAEVHERCKKKAKYQMSALYTTILSIMDNNFIIRMLYCSVYWHFINFITFFYFPRSLACLKTLAVYKSCTYVAYSGFHYPVESVDLTIGEEMGTVVSGMVAATGWECLLRGLVE